MKGTIYLWVLGAVLSGATDAGRRPRPAGPLVGEKVLAGTPREEVPLSVFGRVPHY